MGIFAPEVKIQGVYVLDVAALKQSVRSYELTNHLGNVLSTITDKGVITSAQDYFPFGLTLASRSFTEEGSVYRYSFNGKEDDKETGLQDYGMRIYRTDLGRFLSVDPIGRKYPWNSVYSFAENDVIQSVDLDGLEKYRIHYFYSPGQPQPVAMNMLVVTGNTTGGAIDVQATALNNGITVNGQPIASRSKFQFDVMVINTGSLPSGVNRIEGRNNLSTDEQTLLSQGTRTPTVQTINTNTKRADGIADDNFTYPNSVPNTVGENLTFTVRSGNYANQTSSVTVPGTPQVTNVPVPPVNIRGRGMIALDVTTGIISRSPDPADAPAWNALQNGFNLANQRGIRNITVTITINTPQSNINTFNNAAGRAAQSFRSKFGFNGNVNVNFVAGGDNQGSININGSRVGGSRQVITTSPPQQQQVTQRVFNPN